MNETAPATEKPRKRVGMIVVASVVGLLIGGVAGYVAAQPQITAAQADVTATHKELHAIQDKLTTADANRITAQADLADAKAKLDKLTATIDPVVMKINFPMPAGYPKLDDISTVPSHMRDALDTGTGKVVAVAPGVWAAFPPGATVESAVNALAYDGYCASKDAFEAQYLNGESASGSCW